MRSHRGIVLASVAVIGAASIWLAAALVQVASVTVSASDLDLMRTTRLLRLESALRVLGAQLADQREELALGQRADLPQETVLWVEGERRIVARLLAVDEGVAEPMSESALLDANHASVDELAQLEGIDQATAQALIEQRRAAPGGRFQDLSAVLDAAGLDASSTVPLTVLAHGPVQAPGQIVAQPWSEDARQALAGLLDERSIEVLEGLGEGDAESFAARVAAASPAPEVWGAILRHAAPAEGFQAGRIDVASASAEVLATLDGIDPDKAMHLVAVRDTLSDDSLSLMSWLWTEGGLDRSLEATVLSRITVGSFTWRCMLGIGEVREDDDHDMLQSADWYEVVFDVSEQTPRIALLREHLAAPGALTGLVFPTLSEADEEDEHEDDEDDSSVRTPDDALSDTATEPQVPALIRVDPPEPAMPIAIDIGNSPEPSQPPSTRAVNDPRLGRWR